MKVYIRTTSWDSMSDETLKRLRELTIRPKADSCMLPWTYEQKPSTKVFIARNGRGTILGWCAAKHYGLSLRWYDVDVFVDPKYRKRGVATKLLKHAVRKLRPLHRYIELPYLLEN